MCAKWVLTLGGSLDQTTTETGPGQLRNHATTNWGLDLSHQEAPSH